jgi:Amt family ammonium transporter
MIIGNHIKEVRKDASQLTTQLIGVGISWVFAAVMTFLIIKAIGVFMDIRATSEQEVQGLDITEHGERGYAYQDFMTGSPIGLGSSATAFPQELVAKKSTLA